MAFDYFARQTPDFCLVEVGLGGRLDSTNVIDPILSVITNIGLDHTQFLGETLPEIAGEKAGIIKAGRPVVIGRKQTETAPVFDRVASELGALDYYAENWLTPITVNGHVAFEYLKPENRLLLPKTAAPPLTAIAENLATALTALAVLRQRGYRTPSVAECDEAWSRLHELTYYVGRFQTLERSENGPLCLADSAHNEDGVLQAVNWLQTFGRSAHVVLGMVSDKDHAKVLQLFPRGAEYYFVKADIPRGLPAEQLATKAASVGLRGETHTSVRAGYLAAKEAAGPGGLVFVGGSVFTVAEVLAEN